MFYAVSILGWQTVSFVKTGSWLSLPLSSFIGDAGIEGGKIYEAASFHGVDATMMNEVLRVPAIIPLLLASALLTAFHFWLTGISRRYSSNRN